MFELNFRVYVYFLNTFKPFDEFSECCYEHHTR
jgi:hypothetical protein